MSLWDEMAVDGASILSELGREVEFRNTKFLALVGRNTVDELLADGGNTYPTSYSIRLLVLPNSNLYKTPPKHGEHIKVYGMIMTIVKVTRRPPSPWVDIDVINSKQ